MRIVFFLPLNGGGCETDYSGNSRPQLILLSSSLFSGTPSKSLLFRIQDIQYLPPSLAFPFVGIKADPHIARLSRPGAMGQARSRTLETEADSSVCQDKDRKMTKPWDKVETADFDPDPKSPTFMQVKQVKLADKP